MTHSNSEFAILDGHAYSGSVKLKLQVQTVKAWEVDETPVICKACGKDEFEIGTGGELYCHECGCYANASVS